MKFIYNDREYKIDLSKYSRRNKTNPSKLHAATKTALEKRYPLDIIVEEFPMPGIKLYADFFIPTRREIWECQGRQHTEYVSFFHQNKANFYKGKKNDRLKKEWCRQNDIKLIEIFSLEDLEVKCGKF